MAHHFWCTFFEREYLYCRLIALHLDKVGVSHNLHLSGIFVGSSWHRVTSGLPWTDRLGTRFLGRCSGSNQVRSVPLSSGGGWTIPLYPKTQKKKRHRDSELCYASERHQVGMAAAMSPEAFPPYPATTVYSGANVRCIGGVTGCLVYFAYQTAMQVAPPQHLAQVACTH